jgi:hypothetical protein
MGWGTGRALARPPPRDSRAQGGGAPGVWCSHTGGPRAVRLPGQCSVGEPQRWLQVYWAAGGLHIQHQLRHRCRFYLPSDFSQFVSSRVADVLKLNSYTYMHLDLGLICT